MFPALVEKNVSMVLVRAAGSADLPHLLDIYNLSMLTTTTWADERQSLEERTAWFEARRARGDGVLVAEDEGHVVGFAAYGDFRDTTLWPGYRFTVENTIHVAPPWQGHGIGRALMERLMEHAIAAGKHMMIAAVDGENRSSIDFHRKLGFVEVGRLPEVGWKFGRWLDLVMLQRVLGTGSPANLGRLMAR